MSKSREREKQAPYLIHRTQFKQKPNKKMTNTEQTRRKFFESKDDFTKIVKGDIYVNYWG